MTSAIFLDLDGTLIDPKPGIVGSIAGALRRLDLAVPEDLTWAIGPPLLESFAALGAPDPVSMPK
jgi:phosphoglycolate phosphatase